MDEIRLDLKDRRIINELDIDPKISLSKLAKAVGLSQQVVDYRIRRLAEKGVIVGFRTVVDLVRMGYTCYRIHLRFAHTAKERREEINRFFYNHPFVFWSAFFGGKWDYIVDLFAKNAKDFEERFGKVLKKFREDIQDYDVMVITAIEIFGNKYLIGERFEKFQNQVIFGDYGDLKPPKIDLKILNLIKDDCRMSNLQIAKKLGISRNTVKSRIKKMEKQRLIKGTKLYFNASAFGVTTYKVFFSMQNKEEVESLIREMSRHPNVVYVVRFVGGKWDFDLEIEIESLEKLQDLIIEIRNRFLSIRDYDIVPIFGYTRLDFFPMSEILLEGEA